MSVWAYLTLSQLCASLSVSAADADDYCILYAEHVKDALKRYRLNGEALASGVVARTGDSKAFKRQLRAAKQIISKAGSLTQHGPTATDVILSKVLLGCR